MKTRKRLSLVMALFLTMILTGCFATSTPQRAPMGAKRSGEAPTAAMLPIINTYDQEVADYITEALEKCLAEKNVFKFASKEAVAGAVAGVDLDKMFGLKAEQYAAIGQKLGVDYVIHGTMAVRKSLKLTGWRRDVDISTRLYDSRTGAKVDSWRSMTDFAWTDSTSEQNAGKMAQSAINHTCSKMMERAY